MNDVDKIMYGARFRYKVSVQTELLRHRVTLYLHGASSSEDGQSLIDNSAVEAVSKISDLASTYKSTVGGSLFDVLQDNLREEVELLFKNLGKELDQ